MVITLSILCIILALVGGFFFMKAWKLAGQIYDLKTDTDEYIHSMEQTLSYVYTLIEQAYQEMKDIDRLGAFKSSDEVGTTFALLKQVIDDLEEKVNGEKTEEK